MVQSLVWALVLLSTAPARPAEVAPHADRYSLSGQPTQAAPTFTLLDPAWLLPPIEALETEAAAHREADRAAEVLATAAGPGIAAAPNADAGPFSYPLSEALSAQLHYERTRLFGTAPSEALRDEAIPTFSNRPDRDVVGLNMAWRLSGSTVGLSYQLESARLGGLGSESGLTRFLPNSPQATHSLSLGLTRTWGASQAPAHPEVPLVLPDAEAGPTATPLGGAPAAP